MLARRRAGGGWTFGGAGVIRGDLALGRAAAVTAVLVPSACAGAAVAARAAAGPPAPANAETLRTGEIPHVWRRFSFRVERSIRVNTRVRRGRRGAGHRV